VSNLDDARSPVESSFTPFAFSALCLCFVTVGATTSLFGPLLNAIAERFHRSLPAAGTVLSAYFVGGVLGVLLGWTIVHHFAGRVATRTGLLTMAVGTLGVAGAAHQQLWTLFLLSVCLIGFGFGMLDFSLNTILARTEPRGRAHRLSFANAFWGIGSIVGPLVVILLRPKNFPVLFLMVGVIALVLSPMFRGLAAPALKKEFLATETLDRRAIRPILVTFIVAYILYVGLETAASGWITSDLHASGFSESVGAFVTAGFWLGFTLGRVVGGRLHTHFSAQQLVLGGLVATAISCLAALNHTLALIAFPLAGLVLANVYVFGIIWYQSLVGTDNRGVSFMIVATMSGGALGPGVVSWVVSLSSVRSVPWCLAGLAMLTVIAFVSSNRYRPLTSR
jgi:fucose permease